MPVNRVLMAVALGLGVALTGGTALASDDKAAEAGTHLGRMTPGYTYYNRPGADLAAHRRDILECSAEADRTVSISDGIYYRELARNPFSGSLFMESKMAQAAHRGSAAAGLENCMVVHGWRVVRLPEAEGVALAALSKAELIPRMGAWIGAAEPHGEIVRVWSNEATRASVPRVAAMPAHTQKGLLSLQLAIDDDLSHFRGKEPDDDLEDPLDAKWTKRAIKPAEIANAPADGGVVIVRLTGAGLGNGLGFTFRRLGPRADIPPTDHYLDRFHAEAGLFGSGKDGAMLAFAVPAGQWRIASLDKSQYVLNFCLGAPSFEVKPGQVIYAGAFDLSSQTLGPNLDLAPAKAWLAGQSAADKVTTAAYVNGSLGVCRDTSIYALEVPGAPFDPAYHWGSQARPAAPTTAAPTAPGAGPTAAATR